LCGPHDKLCAKQTDNWFIQYDFVKPILLRGYGVSSANDSPGHEADPKEWEFSIIEMNIHTGENLNGGAYLTFPEETDPFTGWFQVKKF
jgi:hypothetical protein